MNIWTLSVPPRYRRRMSSRDLNRVLDDINEFVARIRANGPGLLARARVDVHAADGLPRSLRSQPGGQRGGHSDPVGDVAVDNIVYADVDVLRRMAADMCEAVMVARDVMRRGDTAWGESLPPAQHDGEPDGGPWCEVHARYKLWVPARARGRCRYCNDYRTTHDCDPGELEIRALENKRIDAELEQAA